MSKASKGWGEQSPAKRVGFVTLGLLDAGLRVWALTDLARRPRGQIRGSKFWWAVPLAVVSSAGIVPVIYLVWARKKG